MENYVVLSLETHLFFARIMKEHGLFLEAGFLCTNTDWGKRAAWFRKQFEELLRDTVALSDGRVGRPILESGEIVTEYTLPAEERTMQLGGIPIDCELTKRQCDLKPGYQIRIHRDLIRDITGINHKALELLDQFIDFKQDILEGVGKATLFTANYPLLVEHIQREARMYRSHVRALQENNRCACRELKNTQSFWNRIMMEHAVIIRGLLDPTEAELIEAVDGFAGDYQVLLEKARCQDERAQELTEKTLKKTFQYRDFKAAGTEGILKCEISSIILPLLADHVLREANHYIRLLQTDYS